MTFQELQTLGALRGDIRLGGDCQWQTPRRPVPVRLAADPGFQGLGVLPAALRDAALVRTRAAPARRPAGGDRGRPGRRLARLGLAGAARRARPEPSRSPGGAAVGPQVLPAAGPLLGRRADEDPPPGAQPGCPRLGSHAILRSCSRPRGTSPRTRTPAMTRPPGGWSGWSLQSQSQGRRDPPFFLDRLLKARPEALVEAVQILIDHPEDVVKVMTRYGYTDPGDDRRLSRPRPAGRIGSDRRDAQARPGDSARSDDSSGATSRQRTSIDLALGSSRSRARAQAQTGTARPPRPATR